MSCNCSSIKQVENVLKNYGGEMGAPEGSVAEKIKYYATVIWLKVYRFFDTIALLGYLTFKIFSKDKKICVAKKYFKEQ